MRRLFTWFQHSSNSTLSNSDICIHDHWSTKSDYCQLRWTVWCVHKIIFLHIGKNLNKQDSDKAYNYLWCQIKAHQQNWTAALAGHIIIYRMVIRGQSVKNICLKKCFSKSVFTVLYSGCHILRLFWNCVQLWAVKSSVMWTDARASTAQLGYWELEGNILFMKAFTNSGNRPSTILCLTDRIRLSW